MKILSGLIISAVTLSLSSQVLAQAEVEIEWDKPDKYRDVRPSNESRKRFREATFEHINEYMNELSLALPDNQKLLMRVSDLDLAGQVWPTSHLVWDMVHLMCASLRVSIYQGLILAMSY